MVSTFSYLGSSPEARCRRMSERERVGRDFGADKDGAEGAWGQCWKTGDGVIKQNDKNHSTTGTECVLAVLYGQGFCLLKTTTEKNTHQKKNYTLHSVGKSG